MLLVRLARLLDRYTTAADNLWIKNSDDLLIPVCTLILLPAPMHLKCYVNLTFWSLGVGSSP